MGAEAGLRVGVGVGAGAGDQRRGLRGRGWVEGPGKVPPWLPQKRSAAQRGAPSPRAAWATGIQCAGVAAPEYDGSWSFTISFVASRFQTFLSCPSIPDSQMRLEPAPQIDSSSLVIL